MKTCKKCGIEKLDKFFYKQTSRSDGLHPWCKSCCKDYVSQNIEAKRENLRAWRARNPERVKELDFKYRKRLVKQRAAYTKIYHARRRQTDVSFKIAGNLRNRLRLALAKSPKVSSLTTALGCSFGELKKYLEKQFVVGMSWDNYGRHGWHVDHKKPLCSFDLTDPKQFAEACHYTNLQPLWAFDNLSKGGR